MLLHEPHHDGGVLHRPDGEPSPGGKAALRVRVPHRPDGGPAAERVAVRAVRDGEPEITQAVVDGVDDGGTWWRADVVAHNPTTSYRFLLDGGALGYAWLNGTGVHRRDVADGADFRLVTHPGPPDWVVDQVAYQVFPDRFARSAAARAGRTADGGPAQVPPWAVPADWDDPVVHRGDDVARQLYGGDLDGVAQKLGHLTRLGVTLLYLTPFFEGRSNHRYDAVSFDRVDPLLGGDAALGRLVRAAHRLGIRVIGDLTTNHTGVGHDWFARARADAGSAEAGFYAFRSHPDDYEGWLGVPSLPKLDHRSVELARRLYAGTGSVAARWIRAGLDGWRIDVANMTGRAGQVDLAARVARELRTTLAEVSDDVWLLAEHGHDASGDLGGDGWHGTMDYSGFTRPVWAWLNGGADGGPGTPHGLQFLGLPVPVPVLPGTAAVRTMREAHAAMPWRSWAASTTHLDTHDTPRFRTVAGGGVHGRVDREGTGRGLHLAGLALQMTMPGVPAVFMGDELGLTGLDGEHARTPFPWDREHEWDRATFDAYLTWTGLRRSRVALRRGGLRWADAGADSMTFLREHPAERVLVHVARAPHTPVRLPLRALGVAHAGLVETLTGDPVTAGPDGTVALPGDGPAAHAYLLP